MTVEPAGVIIFGNGDIDSKDFFAIELVDRYLYLVFDMGAGVERVGNKL